MFTVKKASWLHSHTTQWEFLIWLYLHECDFWEKLLVFIDHKELMFIILCWLWEWCWKSALTKHCSGTWLLQQTSGSITNNRILWSHLFCFYINWESQTTISLSSSRVMIVLVRSTCSFTSLKCIMWDFCSSYNIPNSCGHLLLSVLAAFASFLWLFMLPF